MISFDEMKEYDKYMMSELSKYVKNVRGAYDRYSYQEVYKYTNNFISFTLSNFYLDFTKDILYIEKKDSLVRRSVQTVLYNIITKLDVLLAPILPYTAEEIYRYIPGEKKESVHLLDMPEVMDVKIDEELWSNFFKVKDDVYKALETARNEKIIGSGLEANVYLNLPEAFNNVKDVLGAVMHQLLIVSKVVFTSEELTKYDNVSVKIERSTGEKCNRCWNYVDELDDGICHRCASILKDNE